MSVVVPPGPLYTGTSLSLTCNITLDEVVNSQVDVNVTWSGPGGMLPVNNNRVTVSELMDSPPSYQSNLNFTPLTTGDGGNYTCEVIVAPGDTTTFITMSQPEIVTGSVAVTGRITSSPLCLVHIAHCIAPSFPRHSNTKCCHHS